LVVQRRAGPEEVWTLSHNGETTTPEVFAASAFNQSGPAFSPDGRWIAYSSIDGGVPQVDVQPFPKTGAKHRVTQQPGAAATPLWSPDGQELFYLNLNGGQLMGIDITTDAAFAFGNEQALGIRGFIYHGLSRRSYDITPDGLRFLMVFPAAQADSVTETPAEQINIVQNWFEELKERVPVP